MMHNDVPYEGGRVIQTDAIVYEGISARGPMLMSVCWNCKALCWMDGWMEGGCGEMQVGAAPSVAWRLLWWWGETLIHFYFFFREKNSRWLFLFLYQRGKIYT